MKDQVARTDKERTTAVWVHLPAGTADEAAHRLARLLRQEGVLVTGPTDALPDHDVDVLLVVILDQGLEKTTDGLATFEAQFAPWRSHMVPVSVGNKAEPVFEDRSHLILGQLGEERTVRRILLIGQVGGSALAELFRLTGSAQQWDDGGRQPSLLLRGASVDSALALLGPAASLDAHAALFREFVAASSKRRRRRNRVLAGVSGAITLTLLIVAAVAVGQQRTASAATEVFNRRHDRAESVRLAGLASDLVGVDPDLPWVLASQALSAEETTQARAAALEVLSLVPRHQTVSLPGFPRGLSTDATANRLAVAYTDGRVEIRSGVDGRVVRTVRADGDPEPVTAALAPSGTRVAVFGRSSRLIDVGDGRTVRTLPRDQDFWCWADADHALVSSSGKLGILDVSSGEMSATSVVLHATREQVRACSVAREGHVATLVDAGTVLSVDLDTGTALPGLPAEGGIDVATSSDGDSAYLVSRSGPSRLLTPTLGTITTGDGAGSGSHVSVFSGGYALADTTGQVEVVMPTQRAVARSFTGHRGPATGIGGLSGGRLATVGADRSMRIWDLGTELQRYPNTGEGIAGADLLARMPSSSLESYRPLVSLDAAGRHLTYALQQPSWTGTVDARTLEPVGASVRFGDIGFLMRPSGVAREVVTVHQSGSSGLWRLEDAKDGNATPVWSCPATTPLLLPAVLFGASPDGRRVAVASTSGFRSWTEVACPEETSPQERGYDGRQQQPVAVLVDAAHQASVVSTSGIWWREGERPVSLTKQGVSVTAATLGSDGALYWVTGSEELFTRSGNRTRRIGAVPRGVSAFALGISPDGGLVAAIGNQRSVVLETAEGRLVMDLPPNGGPGSEIRDLAIGRGEVWGVRADGAIIRRPVLDDAETLRELVDHAPRKESADERSSLAGATTIGER